MESVDSQDGSTGCVREGAALPVMSSSGSWSSGQHGGQPHHGDGVDRPTTGPAAILLPTDGLTRLTRLTAME
jgi:hypothetical protein